MGQAFSRSLSLSRIVQALSRSRSRIVQAFSRSRSRIVSALCRSRSRIVQNFSRSRSRDVSALSVVLLHFQVVGSPSGQESEIQSCQFSETTFRQIFSQLYIP